LPALLFGVDCFFFLWNVVLTTLGTGMYVLDRELRLLELLQT
jgi:hypothetical protein